MADIYDFAGEDILVQAISLKELRPGMETGTVFQKPGNAFMVGETRIAPGGGIPGHKGNQEAVFIVVEGDGVIYTENEEGSVLAQAAVKAGDVLHYREPFLNHRYAAGPNGLAYMVIPVPE